MTKTRIESGVERLLKDRSTEPSPASESARTTQPPLDVSKFRIESGVERLVGEQSKGTNPTPSVASTDPSATSGPEPEKVEPGKVRWHDNLGAAMRASADSNKPVLLFQLLGQLDERFT
jgi:hypothetical protein